MLFYTQFSTFPRIYRSSLCDSLIHAGRRCGNKSLSDRPLRRICTFVLLYLRIDITCFARTTRIHYHRESCLCSRRSRSRKYVAFTNVHPALYHVQDAYTIYNYTRVEASRSIDAERIRFSLPFFTSKNNSRDKYLAEKPIIIRRT